MSVNHDITVDLLGRHLNPSVDRRRGEGEDTGNVGVDLAPDADAIGLSVERVRPPPSSGSGGPRDPNQALLAGLSVMAKRIGRVSTPPAACAC